MAMGEGARGPKERGRRQLEGGGQGAGELLKDRGGRGGSAYLGRYA